jgi:hypothetical protein
MEGTTAFASSTVSGHKLPITLTWHSPRTAKHQWQKNLVDKQIKKQAQISIENFSVLMIQVNLIRIERWHDKRVVEILYLMTYQQTRKRGNQTLRNRGRKKPKLRSIFNNSNSQTHVQGPSTATCMVLTIDQLPQYPHWLHQLQAESEGRCHPLTNILSF